MVLVLPVGGGPGRLPGLLTVTAQVRWVDDLTGHGHRVGVEVAGTRHEVDT
jgi:hypothetical protein